MQISLQKLLKLPVHTESGTKIGQVFDARLDVESHAVMEYHVRQNFLSRVKYIIKPVHVKEITAKRVVVYDAVIKIGAVASSRQKKAMRPEMAGNAMTTEEINS